ncbi:uncharacterized protein LOC125759967 [Rhipicephalus sanguineus]|uniref:uncharacterized protein LOC125759967 n=1 Tax=Rhipicephalus sanguineus TaxID=34632 RepID=UPI0020C1E93D|nr:uncharacterized protein LOC125759967 [Rhipicephalus sanguineus]
MECSVAAEDDRMNESSSVQADQMTGGSTVADNDPFNELLVLKRQLNLEQKKRAKAEKECRSLKDSFSKIFAGDQLRYVQKRTMRGSAWSDSTVQESLNVRLACGSRGYEHLRDNGWPLPAERTLQKNIENIKFSPGILEDVFPALAAKVATFKAEDRYAVIMLDEMQLTPGLDYDCTTRSVIGHSTVASSDPSAPAGLATHALVFMLGGVTSRWKQTIAYHFSADSFDAKQILAILFDIIRKCEAIGLSVDFVTSDMGSGNQAIWRLCSITATKYGCPRTTCPHPCDEGRSLHFLADAPHLLKNLRGHLVMQQKIVLDDETVVKNKLPTNEVKYYVAMQAGSGILCSRSRQEKLISLFTKNAVRQLLAMLPLQESGANRGQPVPPMIASTSHVDLLSTFQTVTGDLVRIPQSTVCRAVGKVTILIARHLYSMLAVTEPHPQFYDVVASWPGSIHASRIFDRSYVRLLYEERRVPGVLLGDMGYACHPFLMTLFHNPAKEDTGRVRQFVGVIFFHQPHAQGVFLVQQCKAYVNLFRKASLLQRQPASRYG